MVFFSKFRKVYNLYFNAIFDGGIRDSELAIISLIRSNSKGKLLDVGCDNGEWTMKLAQKMKIGRGRIFGIDVVKERYNAAIKKGIIVKEVDLNNKFPFKDEEFDLVHANQVIEHLWSLDNFVSEIKRVLKKNGYVIICTENLSSWHNIVAVLLGFQPFSLTNISSVGAIGNPFALTAVKGPTFDSWKHTRVLTYYGLKEIFRKHGFVIEESFGFGYFPFPSIIARFLARLDPTHAAFPLIKARKIK